MSDIPKDPMMLLSFINTKLRDHYKNLSLLCEDLEIDSDALTNTLAGINYHYDEKLNRFV